MVFAPGEADVDTVAEKIAATAPKGTQVMALKRKRIEEVQDAMVAGTYPRLASVATNLLEVSYTIPDLGCVVGMGYTKLSRYDQQRCVGMLEWCRVSDANARQRAGRTGRACPGKAIRLWPESLALC